MTEKAGVVIGIVTGVLGALLAVGFALLPTSTGAEKGYVVIAALALSVAAVTGIGAWRSGRRFAFTAIATALAVICLAGLSVAARAVPTQAPQSTDVPAAGSVGSGQPTTAPPSMTASAPDSSPATPPSTPSTPAGGSQSLIDMTPVSGGSSSFQSGPQSVDAHSYQQTLYDTWDDYECGGGYSPNDTTYELNYKYHQFRVVVGLADSSPSGDTIQFSVLVDGQQKGISPTLGVGQTEPINVNVTGAYRITLQDTCANSANAGGNNIIVAWINPTVSP